MNIRDFRKNRKLKIKRISRRRPINVLASVMTTISLYFGMTSIIASIGREFEYAALFILLAILFDAFDGMVAPMTKSVSEYGKELDSLCDLVSFGVAPGILVFMAYLPEWSHLPLPPRAESIVGKTGSYAAIIYVICTALRLARFNIYQADRRDSFVGLPSPAAGGTIATFVLFLQYYELRLETHEFGPLAYYALGPLAVILALLMVSTIRYPKDRFKSFILAPRHAFPVLGFCAFAIAVIHYAVTTSPFIVLFPLAMTYVLFGIGDTIYARHLVKRGILPADEKTKEKAANQTPPSDASPTKNADRL